MTTLLPDDDSPKAVAYRLQRYGIQSSAERMARSDKAHANVAELRRRYAQGGAIHGPGAGTDDTSRVHVSGCI